MRGYSLSRDPIPLTPTELAAPELQQRSIFAQHRVTVRQRHLGNYGQGLGPIGRIVAAAKIIGAVRRIGADDNKILAARKLLPALFSLWHDRYLPASSAIIGIGRRDKTDCGRY